MADAHDDYWANEFDVGTLSTWSFAGEDGLRRLTGPARYSAPQTARFSARLSRVQLDHVALEAFASTAHAAVRGESEIDRFATPLVSAVLLVEGRIDAENANGAFRLRSGEHTILDSRVPLEYTASSDVRMLRGIVGVEHVPPYLQAAGATLARSLPRTRLSDSYFAFVSNILKTTPSGKQAQGDHLITAVAELQNAVLAEALEITGRPSGPAGLRYRMEEHIEANLDDPDLDPTAVAASVRIGVRHAHAIFADGGQSIARFITDRRISAVARELRLGDGQGPLAPMHVRYGFTSQDVLGRAFRERFGMSPTEYRRGGHRSFG